MTMSRTYLLVAVIAVVAGGIIVWGLADEPGISSAEAAGAPSLSEPADPASPVASQPRPTPVAVTKTTAQWIADTASGDAATRAAAISALAEAPRREALPVLARILTDGEPEVDRVLALQSLRDLALNQGDADGAVRDAIRHVIYHGDDFTRVEAVQEALEIIEESLQVR
jgi:hypothetical protein